MQGHGDQAIHWFGLYPGVFHGFDQKLGEDTAQIKLPAVFRLVNQLSQDAFGVILGDHAIKGGRTVFAVGAKEMAGDKALEGSGATLTKWRPDRGCGLFALVAEKCAGLLRQSAPDTIRRVKELQQSIKKDPYRVSHADKLSKLVTR